MQYDPDLSYAAHAAVPSRQRGVGFASISGRERGLSALIGAGLLGLGLKRGGLSGLALIGAGAALGARAATGKCPVTGLFSPPDEVLRVAEERRWHDAAVVSRAVTINRPRAELYRVWRDFTRLAEFMENVKAIEVLNARRTRWTVAAPGGRDVRWEAVVTEDLPDQRIAWETAPGADVKSAGWVEFKDAPAGRGTEVRALIVYEPPFGKLGRVVAKIMQREPQVQARRDLRRFKQLMETGEISTSRSPIAASTPEGSLRDRLHA